MLEPVQKASGKSRKLNSVVDHRYPFLRPAAQVQGDQRQIEDKFQHEIAVAGYIQTVRGHAVEAELPAPRCRGRWECEVPASAAAPSDRTLTRLRQSARRSRSR